MAFRKARRHSQQRYFDRNENVLGMSFELIQYVENCSRRKIILKFVEFYWFLLGAIDINLHICNVPELVSSKAVLLSAIYIYLLSVYWLISPRDGLSSFFKGLQNTSSINKKTCHVYWPHPFWIVRWNYLMSLILNTLDRFLSHLCNAYISKVCIYSLVVVSSLNILIFSSQRSSSQLFQNMNKY